MTSDRTPDAVDGVLVQWRVACPDLDSSPIGVVGRIMRLSRLWDAEINALLATHGLEPGEFDLLSTLRRSGQPYALTAGAFLASSLVTSGAITNRVDRMESKGLVERVRDTADRRSVRIRLTDEGLDLIERVLPVHFENEARLLEPLHAAERGALEATLSRLLGPYEAEVNAPEDRAN